LIPPVLLLAVLGLVPPAAAQDFTAADCADCHAQADEDVPYVAEEALVGSVHDDLDCLDCHAGIDDLPHAEKLPAVRCGECHEEEAAVYRKHGRALVGEDPDIPNCADCHGSHGMLPSANSQSLVSPRRLPETCGRCHSDVDLAKKHDIQLKRPVEVYETSVHGQATLGGVIDFAATCNDCHSTEGTAHQIWGPGDPASSINHFNIPSTCGKCHESIEREYWEGIHGQLTARGETDTPVCTHCHGEHGILPTWDERARVSPTHVAEATCAPCHESAFLNEKYGLPAGRLASFVDSYHGLKSRTGDTKVANCASCHGSHLILPSWDSRSSINPNNLRKTCGSCHPGISAEMATMKIHETGTGRHTGWSDLFASIYTVAIILIIGSMLLYTALDFIRAARKVHLGTQVRRMSPNALAQHTLLAVAFSLLVLTGFALRFSEAWVFRVMFGWDGGFLVRGVAHRFCAVLFMFGCVWHVIFLFSRTGRQFLRDMWPRPLDFEQFGQMMAYNIGHRAERPKFARFSFIEKAEYWALIWGSVVMIITGLLLWFDNWAVNFVPKGFLDVMLVIHFYEAVLATLAIGVWHFYSTIFNPEIYPGNPAWLTGKMPKEMHEHEHPAET